MRERIDVRADLTIAGAAERIRRVGLRARP
jgi:hypothetical protein